MLNIVRRIIKAINTLIFALVIACLKLIGVVIALVAFLLESLALLIYGSAISHAIFDRFGARLSHWLLITQQLQLLLVDAHIASNVRYIRSLGYERPVEPAEPAKLEKWHSNVPMPTVDSSELN